MILRLSKILEILTFVFCETIAIFGGLSCPLMGEVVPLRLWGESFLVPLPQTEGQPLFLLNVYFYPESLLGHSLEGLAFLLLPCGQNLRVASIHSVFETEQWFYFVSKKAAFDFDLVKGASSLRFVKINRDQKKSKFFMLLEFYPSSSCISALVCIYDPKKYISQNWSFQL